MSRREFCIDCGDDFRYDDCGGYNPPCVCGFHCDRCHEREQAEIHDEDDGRDEDDYPPDRDETPEPSPTAKAAVEES